MFYTNLEPEHRLRYKRNGHGTVLQERVKGRKDGQNYYVWRDVPMVEPDASDDLEFNSDTICD